MSDQPASVEDGSLLKQQLSQFKSLAAQGHILLGRIKQPCRLTFMPQDRYAEIVISFNSVNPLDPDAGSRFFPDNGQKRKSVRFLGIVFYGDGLSLTDRDFAIGCVVEAHWSAGISLDFGADEMRLTSYDPQIGFSLIPKERGTELALA